MFLTEHCAESSTKQQIVIVDTEIVNLQYIHKTPMVCCGLRQKQYYRKKTSEFSLKNQYVMMLRKATNHCKTKLHF